ncbi:MAG TPA: phosphoribosylformylglycinamidine synthase subunit PurL [Myxococcota bacterium]|nr:phosphoribosylformylglycinamidine synthase subunit PurL [Myxococcota bacterium]
MKDKTIASFSTLSDLSLTHEQHAHEAGLSLEEYDRIKRLLGRVPSKVELGIIGAMWSEHCSYKSSRAHLSKLPVSGPQVLVGPGENAGAIDIGDGLAIVFKIESHNHPSFIEPFQGAATGVGGILRDIFTMGARPFALANLLRFGKPSQKRVPFLLNGVVGGIASYGNCFGVPTVMSNVDFHESYDGNNLVNAFAIGVVQKEDIFFGRASGVKNRVLYVGAKTGRDGIMGAVMASDTFMEDAKSKRPTVQVGDPFIEKLLLEACLLAFKEKLVVGVQDMGAAGLTCSIFEMANRASTGLAINLDHVPLRDETMTAYDIMLSESQERMLMVVAPKDVARLKQIFEHFGLDCADIGHVSGDGIVRIHHKGHDVVELSATLIIENAPRYRRSYISEIPALRQSIKDGVNVDVATAVESFKNDLGQKDLTYITSQFDHHIGLATIVGPNVADAVLIKVPNSRKAVALSLVSHGKLCKIHAMEGARRLIFQAALEVSTQGAEPVGITNCLNFGSPENVPVMTDLKHAIDGMAQAATSLSVPVVSGNVSLYNETKGQPILPTLAICLVGLADTPSCYTKFSRAKENHRLVLLGELPDDYTGAEAVIDELPSGMSPKPWDGDFILCMAAILRRGVLDDLIDCASVVGRGGLLLSLIKIMAGSGLGADLDLASICPRDELSLALLSEDAPRVLLAMSEDKFAALAKLCENLVPINALGRLHGDEFAIKHQGQIIFSEQKNVLIANFATSLEEYLASH